MRAWFGRIAAAIFLTGAMMAVALLAPLQSSRAESICVGTSSAGSLIGGVRLPSSGDNFRSYGWLPEAMGRTFVHSTVRDVLVDAFRRVREGHPDTVFVYAETGWETGGAFEPHRTHRNGTSVDIHVPILDRDGEPDTLRTTVLNRFGYDEEFDSSGIAEDGSRIDFDALGALILALDDAARARGVGVWRVIFAPDLQPELFASRHGEQVRDRISIPDKRSWVRHDEHIHVDFDIPCRR